MLQIVCVIILNSWGLVWLLDEKKLLSIEQRINNVAVALLRIIPLQFREEILDLTGRGIAGEKGKEERIQSVSRSLLLAHSSGQY